MGIAVENVDMTGARTRRLRAQLLSGEPSRTPEQVAGRILAIQAQDPRGARLAIRARSSGLTAADVDRSFTQDRSIVITWLNRGTLHLIRSEDYQLLQTVTAPRLEGWVFPRLRQLDVTPAQAEATVEFVARTLEHGPLDRRELRGRIQAAGLPVEGQAFIHQMFLAAARGLVVRGPMIGKQQAFVLTRDWLGEYRPMDRETALAELARRYLAGHGPATAADLAYWTGISLTEARLGLRRIASELVEGDFGLVDLAGRSEPTDLASPRLLGPFDPVLHGWASREPIVGEDLHRIVNGGLFRPFVLAGGRAVGSWTIPAGGHVKIEPFEPFGPEVAAALEADARDVERFLGART
jgi:hypothetical protein